MAEWRPVPGWEDLYQISDSGDILSARTGKPMKPYYRKYLRVQLSRDGSRTGYLIHRLVALAFLGPCPPGMQVCHNDGNHLNNTVTNLRYDTPGENMYDQVQHGRHQNANKTHCKRGHPFDEVNTEIGRDGSRHCKACHRVRDREKKRRIRALNPEKNRAAVRAWRVAKKASDLSAEDGNEKDQPAVTVSLFSTWAGRSAM